jgi:hypothetical protein
MDRPIGIMRRGDVVKAVPDAVRSSPSSKSDRTWQIAADVFSCGVATAELATAGLGPEMAPVVLDGVFRAAACVTNLAGDFSPSEQDFQQTHNASSVMSINGLLGGLAGLAIGGTVDSMALGADLASLSGDTFEQAVTHPKSGPTLLVGAQFVEYLKDGLSAMISYTPSSKDDFIDSRGMIDTRESSKDFKFTGGDPSDVKDSLPDDLKGPEEIVA